jgi:hypothetical protein
MLRKSMALVALAFIFGSAFSSPAQISAAAHPEESTTQPPRLVVFEAFTNPG